jgi:hypothetical protein
MNRLFFYISLIILLFLTAGADRAFAQTITTVSGRVTDETTGEPLSFVSVIFENSTVGVMTDDEGLFSLRNDKGYANLIVSSLGYETQNLKLNPEIKNEELLVRLRPNSFEIEEVLVRPQRERYSRRDNPAVELIRKVIERKSANRVEAKDEYKVELYEKLTLALDNFNPDFENNRFLKKFGFIKNYMDTSEVTGKPILTVSVRETISDRYYRKSLKTEKTIVKAKRQEGVDKALDESGSLSGNLEEVFKSVNIFDNNIDLLLNRFVSPLSSSLAVAYYQYYIMDTLDIAGDRCIDLAFVPVNSESYGFTGRLYITLDGNYSVKKFVLNVPKDINLNWVDRLQIEQSFKRGADSTWVPDTENTYVNLYVVKGGQQLYAHQFRNYDKYDFNPPRADSTFNIPGALHILPEATARTDSFWVNNRHVPLKEKEDFLKDLLAELRKVPSFNAVIKTMEILISGYIRTKPKKTESLFDFGPMNTTFTANELEGFRFRVGGTTTANLHPRWFLNGYAAYGLNDRKMKYQAKVTHSFADKEYHEKESPMHNLSLMHEYDVYTPGQDFLFTSKDNMFVAWKVGEAVTHMQYIRKTVLQYDREWLNGLSLKGWLRHENNEAAGTLKYGEYTDEYTLRGVKDFTSSEAGFQLRYAPGERAFNTREGKGSVFNLSRDAPVFKVSHRTGFNGILGSDYKYNHTELSAEKRVWLSSFGHIDATVKAGKVWDRVPFPMLLLPNTNRSITIQPESFAMMQPMEFITDQYASFYLTYYLKGWILNRIPVVKWLKMREVVSISGMFGELTNKNNPAVNPVGLFMFPEGTRPIGRTPYVEASVGLENIFKILRIDYYRRLTYLNEPGIKKGGFRIALRFSF